MKSELITIGLLDDLKHEMINKGLITAEQIKSAEKEAGLMGEGIGRILIDKGFISSERILNFIGERLHIPYVKLEDYTIDKRVIALIPETVARRYKVIPLFEIEGTLTVAMADPVDIMSFDVIVKVTGCSIEPVLSSEQSLLSAIKEWYGRGEVKQELIEELADEIKEAEKEEAKEITGVPLEEETEKSVVKRINEYIVQAVLQGASDIHLEPMKDSMLVRFRIDGFLYSRHRLPAKLIAPVTSRIKIISGMDIAKKRVPQDGRMSLTIRDRNVDVRTSTYPATYGENVVMRLFDKTAKALTLPELGFLDEDSNTLKKLLKANRGMILATGPTGSGKTTTIYSAINILNTGDKNLMTIEDPIEYEVAGIVQSQVDYKAGLTFANALRSILRQDPDIIYVGEIRDSDTAEIAIRAALTGHLVFSTLHTNDAVGTITRLRDIGVDAGMIGSALNCSFAQRLVRRICPRCRIEYRPEKDLLEKLNLSSEDRFYKGQGCEFCGGIGYRGRTGIFEMLVVTGEIGGLITRGASEDEILKIARAQGMKTLFENGLFKATKGITTLDEIMRVAQ